MAASMNATARMLGVSHRVHISSAEAEPARTPQKAATPPQKHAKRALRYMSDAEIAAYVSEVADTIQFEGSVMPGVEALVYGHCVKIVLSLVHEALDALPAFGILGLRLDVAPQKRRGLDLVEALRRRRNSLLFTALRCCFFGFGAARGSPGGLRGVPGVPRTGPGAGRPLEMGLVS